MCVNYWVDVRSVNSGSLRVERNSVGCIGAVPRNWCIAPYPPKLNAGFAITTKSLDLECREMGSPSGEPAQEAFWKDKAERTEIARRIGRAAVRLLLRGGVIEDASLLEDYGSIRSTY
jgi:hypothetical protein